MSESFDYAVFNLECGRLHAHSKDVTFEGFMGEAKSLRTKYTRIATADELKYVRGSIDRTVFKVCIDQNRPFPVVCRRFERLRRMESTSLWSEVFSTIEFAEYCVTNDRRAIGLNVIRRLQARLTDVGSGSDKKSREHMLRELNKCSRRITPQEEKSTSTREASARKKKEKKGTS
jgi:hypothetical protein